MFNFVWTELDTIAISLVVMTSIYIGALLRMEKKRNAG